MVIQTVALSMAATELEGLAAQLDSVPLLSDNVNMDSGNDEAEAVANPTIPPDHLPFPRKTADGVFGVEYRCL